HEAFDRRSVEHDLAVERLLELPIGDFDVLDRAENVRELQAHELDLLALGALDDLRLGFPGGPARRGVRFGHAPNSSQLFGANLRLKAKRGPYEIDQAGERGRGGRGPRPSSADRCAVRLRTR